MGKKNSTSSSDNHILAWLISLATIPAITLALIFWYIALYSLLSLITPHLGSFLNDVFDDFFVDSGLIAAIGGGILWMLSEKIIGLSYKICPPKNGTRYIVTAIFSGAIAIFGFICLLRGSTPFPFPVRNNGGVLFCTSCSMSIYAFKLIEGVVEMRRNKKEAPAPVIHICIFCHSSGQPGTSYTPFCYFTGGTGLVHSGGSLEVPGRNGDRLDVNFFFKLRDYVYDHESVLEKSERKPLYATSEYASPWKTILVFDGYIIEDKAYCVDMIETYPNSDKWNYADLLNSPIFDKNGVTFGLGDHKDLKYCRHYKLSDDNVIEPLKPAANQKTLEKLLEENQKISAQIKSKPVAASPIAAPVSKTTQTKPQPKAAAKASSAKANTGKASDKSKIYLLFDSSLSDEDRSLIGKAASEVNKLFPMCDVVNMDNSPRAETNRKNADTYLEGTISGGRADSSVVIRKLQNAYTALPSAAAVILLTARDLYSSSLGLSWCFGAANYGKHVSVQSVFRYQKLTKEEKLRCIRRTLRHELGHTFGLANDLNRVNTEDLIGHHCTAPGCSMRQTGTLSELLQCSAEEDRLGTYFCKDCLADLNRYFSKNAPAKKPAANTQASKPASSQTPIEKTPKSREELIDAIFEYYGSDIFASAERLHIHLENVFDLRKETYNTATLRAILDDLKEHASK